jgi:hypothetical protein
MKDDSYTYFKYHSEQELPVYIRLETSAHDEALPSLLESMKFRELKDDELSRVGRESRSRILTITPAGINASRQIEAAVESDRFGRESVIPKAGYKVYRYKSLALIVYSYGADEWECGVSEDFGIQDFHYETRIIINRYLCWALAPLGLIGFWGAAVKEGVVILKQTDAQGRMVFLDPKNKKILSVEGVKRFPALFKMMRLDPNLHQRNTKMNSDQLLSFLSLSAGFLDPEGHSVATRQLLHELARTCIGLNHPAESFQSRSELSL